MTIKNIDVEASIDRVKALIAEEDDMSPALKSSLEVLLLLVTLMADRFGLNSKNSSKPPSSDPNRKKEPKTKSDRKPGGQNGRKGTTLTPVSEPDYVEILQVDQNHLPPGPYRAVGFESRQVVDLDISAVVTEYRAQILEDRQGKRYVAPFPKGVTRPVQYGPGVKAHSVYMSQFQLIPYKRIEELFLEQMQIPVSAGSIFNFNQDAYNRLASFDQWIREKLPLVSVLHVDETGINIGGKRVWLHTTSSPDLTFLSPHTKRGGEALDSIGILPQFNGILCHDHWKPYFKYAAQHSLCNAHHLRELERAWEQDKQQWAHDMAALLNKIDQATKDAGGCLGSVAAEAWRKRYRNLLKKADSECPAPAEKQRNGRRGKLARTKARNLLERLRNFESDVLRFMEESDVPFTNNLAERDLRMTKVQQKISGCFRSWDGAEIFCRIRSYLSTCRKQGVNASEALRLLFEDKSPQFMMAE